MRTGIFISAVSHVALVAFVLLGTPKLFESVPLQTIEVDLVRAQELEPEPPKEPEKKPPEKTAEWNPLPEASAAQEKPATKEVTAPPRSTKQSVVTQQARAPQPPARRALHKPLRQPPLSSHRSSIRPTSQP